MAVNLFTLSLPQLSIGSPGLAAGAWALGVLLLMPAQGALAQPTAAPEHLEAERLVFLLQYIAVDYGVAVQDGAIVNPFEYQEMQRFSQLAVDQLDDLGASGASEEVRAGLVQLREKIRAARPWGEVRALASDLAEMLVRELDVIALPTAAPDVDQGRQVYGQLCATCHGPSGSGDGPAAPGMEPPPTSLSDSRMNLVSPHQLYGATKFGIEGTAMPSYESKLDPKTIWDLSFFIMTLRSGFAPRPPEQELPLTLTDLARRSNEDLVVLARDLGADVDPEHIDHYRASPESARPTPREREPRSGADRSPDTKTAGSSMGSDLQVALRLQGAFAGVAEQAGPSVVGVTGLRRQADAHQPAAGGVGAWREGSVEERLYPGFEPARSGSGFIVSDDGYILTAHHLLTDEAGDLLDVFDVELHQGRHRIARIVGTEPTINLGVLKLEDLSRPSTVTLRPARIGDSEAVRVGYWTIALGNPAGPGTTFAVGTLSSRPERQCYQENLTATLMQTSLSVPPGGYGGPLMNIEGEVVGMMVPGPGAGFPELVAPPRPLGFALPIDLVMAIYEPLKVKESRKSPWLGFSVLDAASRRSASSEEVVEPPQTDAGRRRSRRPRGGVRVPRIGVYIDDVFDPSPAAAADLRVGDKLISIDGNRLVSVGEFQKWLYLSGIGRTITLKILRGGELLEKRITVEERPAAVVPR